jgi:hypothetical protein
MGRDGPVRALLSLRVPKALLDGLGPPEVQQEIEGGVV